jgi:hypothetical protein
MLQINYSFGNDSSKETREGMMETDLQMFQIAVRVFFSLSSTYFPHFVCGGAIIGVNKILLMNNNLVFVNSPTNFIKPIIGPLAIRNYQRSGLNVLRLSIIYINQIILKKVAIRFYSNVVFKTHCYFF